MNNIKMPTDALKELVKEIENWCAQNELVVFKGTIIKKNCTEVLWDFSLESEWKSFLSTIKKMGAISIIMEVHFNTIDTESDLITLILGDYDGGLKVELQKAIKTLRRNRGFVTYFEISFFQNNINYKYVFLSDWMEEYMLIETLLNDFEDDDDDDSFEDDENLLN